MARRSLQEEILEAFLIALNEAEYLLKRDGPLAPEDHNTQIRRDTENTRSRGGFSRNPASRKLRRAIQKQVKAAERAGKPFAYGREGGVAGRDREEYAQRFARRRGVNFRGVNIEHPETDIESDSSRPMKRLKRKLGPAGAEGARNAFLGGQGDDRYRTQRGDQYLRSQGVDPDDQDSKYDAAFPEDKDEKLRGKTPIGKAQLDINKMRRAGVLSKTKDLQQQGYHVGGTYGEGHFEPAKRAGLLSRIKDLVKRGFRR